MKNILIIGASSGIGKETAKLFPQNGHKVIAVSRNIDKMQDLEKLGCITIKMDITKEDSIQNGFQKIYTHVEKIDVLVNNAGFSQNGFVKELR